MTCLKVISSTILSVGYEPDSEVLQLEFPGNNVYQFHNVNPVIYMGLMDTDLKGHYFNEHIKNRYQYTQLAESK